MIAWKVSIGSHASFNLIAPISTISKGSLGFSGYFLAVPWFYSKSKTI